MILNIQRHCPNLLLIACTVTTTLLNAQNPIPNGDFEAYDDCSFTTQSFILANDWIAPLCWSGITYQNTCVPTNIPLNPWVLFSAPQNSAGYQHPSNGNGYASVSFYILSTGRSSYPTVELSTALQPGVEYCLSLMMSLADSSSYSVNTMHALFTNVQPSLCVNGRDSLWDDMAQMTFDISALDTTTWSVVQGSFVAAGGERFLTLGNFFSPFEVLADTVVLTYYPNHPWSLHYLDNIILTTCDVGIDTPTGESGVELYPNPASGSTYLKVKDPAQWHGYQLRSATGRSLRTGSIASSKTTIPLQGIVPGTYVLTLQGERTRRQVRFIVVE